MSEDQRKNARVWFISGVSRGFGRELAQAAIAEGDLVIGTTRSGESDIRSDGPSILPLDVTPANDVTATVEGPGQSTAASMLW
jgi:NAD(P)-dependent dehydrogenase (short-subunit alcohol dehydrogenase family)